MLYLIKKKVNIRREPKIVGYSILGAYITNVVGQYAPGDVVDVHPETVTDKDGVTWGRVSDVDANRKADWFAIRTRHTTFAELQPDQLPESVPPAGVVNVVEWARAVDEWARLAGYRGPGLL